MEAMIRKWLQEIAEAKKTVMQRTDYGSATQRNDEYLELTRLENDLAARIGVKVQGRELELMPIGNKGKNKPLKLWGSRT